MNKIIITFILAMFVSSGVFARKGDIKVFIDDIELKTDTPARAVNDRTLVPLRAIFESMGASVNWDNTSKTITAIKDRDEISLKLGSVSANINGREIRLDAPALVTNGVTLVPVRFVAESFGAYVFWNEQYQTVYIDSRGRAPVIEEDDKYEVSQFTNSKHFEFDKITGEIRGYSKTGPKDVIIPDRIAGIKVIGIGKQAFEYRELKSIEIPDSILNISDGAFSNNDLTKVDIPENIRSINKDTFANNRINTVNLAKGVVTLGDGAFRDNNLTLLELPKSIRGIGDYAFANNKLKTVSFQIGVSKIGHGAFMDNNLKSIELPSSLMDIGRDAYKNNNITTVYVPWYINLDNHAFDSWVNVIKQ